MTKVYLIIITLSLLLSVIINIVEFIKMPKAKKLENFKQWLVYAVLEAEKQFGSKTGELKLRAVYDSFLVKFPYLSKLISFEAFTDYVQEALAKAEELLDKNGDIKAYIEN